MALHASSDTVLLTLPPRETFFLSQIYPVSQVGKKDTCCKIVFLSTVFDIIFFCPEFILSLL